MNEFHIYHKQLTFETQGNKATYFEIRQDCRRLCHETGIQKASLSYSHRIPLALSSLKKWSMTLMHSVMNICRLT